MALPIRTVLTFAVLLPALVASAALLAVFSLSTHRVAEDLGRSLTEATAEAVEREVRGFLGEAVRCSDSFAHRIVTNQLPADRLSDWRGELHAELLSSPPIASVCFGREDGAATWLLRGRDREADDAVEKHAIRLEYGLCDPSVEADGRAREWRMNDKGMLGETLRAPYDYDPRLRPWYGSALGAIRADEEPDASLNNGESDATRIAGSVWTPIYNWFEGKQGEAVIGTGYTRAILQPSRERKVMGVLVVDVTLGSLSEFLRGRPLAGQSGAAVENADLFGPCAAIVDSENRIIAVSRGGVTDRHGSRYLLADSPDPVLRSVGRSSEFAEKQGGFSVLPPSRAEETIRIEVRHLRLGDIGRGLDWRLIVALPETSFMAEARSAERHGMLLAIVAVVGAIATALVLGSRLARPIHRIADRLTRLGQGDFDSRLTPEGAVELRNVSSELNSVAAGLRQRMEMEKALGVAKDVQLALLPRGERAFHKLDVCGRARYCDETGGDYFDYLDIAPASATATLLALGDVMGHGVGAALLMATARAALRARADDAKDLGILLTQANRLLAESTRSTQFVTMSLVMIDPVTGEARWASAGHDPAIVFDPVTEEFSELEGGYIPLGVADDSEYEEYQRADVARTGRIIVLGSDGIWETRHPKGEMYGKDRLREIVRAHARFSAIEIAEALEKDLDAFRGDGKQTDDVTFVIAKVL